MPADRVGDYRARPRVQVDGEMPAAGIGGLHAADAGHVPVGLRAGRIVAAGVDMAFGTSGAIQHRTGSACRLVPQPSGKL